MKYENLPFVDAVEKLASEFSMQVRYEGGAPKPKSGKPRLSEIMQRAMEFYRDKFNSDKFSQDYLHNRGLTDETIERFGIQILDKCGIMAPVLHRQLERLQVVIDQSQLLSSYIQFMNGRAVERAVILLSLIHI